MTTRADLAKHLFMVDVVAMTTDLALKRNAWTNVVVRLLFTIKFINFEKSHFKQQKVRC